MKYVLILALIVMPLAAATHATDDFIVKQKVVEFDNRYFQGVNGYYSVGEELRRERNEEQSQEIAKLRAQVELLIELMKNKDCGDDNDPKPPTPPVDPTPTPPTNPEPPTNGPSDLEKQVYQIFNNYCVDCHGVGADEGRLRLINEDTGELFNYGTPSIADIIQRTEKIQLNGKKKMPLGGVGLTDKELLVLKDWLYKTADEELAQE